MDTGTVRLDGSVRTDFDVYEIIREIKSIKRITFCSFLDTRKQIDFIYSSNFGEVKCSVVKESKRYSGYLNYQGRYYELLGNDAMIFYNQMMLYIEKNK